MRILLVNKFYYLRGGAEKYLLEIEKALQEAGHEVAIFAMNHPKNLPTPYQKYFPSRVSFSEGGFNNKLKALVRLFWSWQSARKFRHLIANFKPDLIHFHNIYHHLSPSIVKVGQKMKIPMIMHLHDYKLICPNYQLFSQGKYCQRCQGGRYYNCLRYRCLKGSYLKSALAALAMYYHNYVQIYEKNLSYLIAPSRFIKNTFIKFGWPNDKIKLLYNFSQAQHLNKKINSPGDYLLYFGRLSQEKGINVLIEALKQCSLSLKIAGSGPEEGNLVSMVENMNLSNRIEFLGFCQGQDLEDLIDGAKAIIIPSVWPENMPFSLLEAMAKAKVVIASKTGGLSELIEDGKNGFIFPAGSAESLAKILNQLENKDLLKMGQLARQKVVPLELKEHLNQLLEIYKETINNQKN